MRKTDSEIQLSVLQELEWDTRVEATDVGVEVEQGVVTLTGTVSSWAKRVAAQEAAHRVVGVCDVANDIEVEVPGGLRLSDTAIALAIRRALEWDALVPDDRIHSTVSRGWVTLEGGVETGNERTDAERAVRNIKGVRGVSNKIEVAVRAEVKNLQDSIEQALLRQAEREARRVDVDVQDGCVKLTGVVHSWAERQAIVGAVKGTRGVRRVSDDLRLEPYAG